ncbi:MAG: hypothetical protein OJJ21_06035 [Ferrovibrio sp.]|uniref:hypothetical protein n=1 Tax=Ferrovibrio sp. TaxID=1917215 RepID=UPI00260D3A79|nr:hypothetical protein [Ferrovibrio sp.]MCW0233141.1 hypothetical protein [Ferrovibrio sp.]
MNLMEATIFAVLISMPPSQGPAFGCRLTDDPKQALCSNDLVIKEFEDGTLEFGARVTVKKNRRRELVFSNGVTAYFDSFGWLQFSNGYAVRRIEGDSFKITQPGARDLTCRYSIQGRQTRCMIE